MTLSLYQYSQLCCIVETLVFSFTLMRIGNTKLRTVNWLKIVKWAVAFVMMIVGLITALQFRYDMSTRYPDVDLALNATMLYIVTFALSVAFLPLAAQVHMTRQRVLTTLITFSVSIILMWASLAYKDTVSNIMTVVSLAIYFIELVRIALVFIYHYRLIEKQERNPGSDEDARRGSLDLLARSIILLLVFAVLYVFLVMWTDKFKAFHNFAMLTVWAYLYIAFVNLIINYNPEMDIDYGQSHAGDEDTSSTLPHTELTAKVNQWIEKQSYCAQGITMVAVAEQLGTNRNYLSQYINSHYQCNFNAWINGMRINKAKQLMNDSPTLPIETIAHNVGFATKSHFISAFKSTEGVTPGQWRKQNS